MFLLKVVSRLPLGVLYVISDVIFLILLLLWVARSRGRGSRVDRTAVSDVQALLATVDLELPPRRLGERIFGPQDLDFVATRTTSA